MVILLILKLCLLSAQNCLYHTASPQTTYQRQVLNDMSSESDARTTPGLYSDNMLDSDELTHDLLLNALSTWRTTWYLDNKWRDSNLDNLIVVRQLYFFLIAFSCICFTRSVSLNSACPFLVNANSLKYLTNRVQQIADIQYSTVQDMKDISEHVRITAAIACGAALGYRTDWDLGMSYTESF